jgi:hypothetical protein
LAGPPVQPGVKPSPTPKYEDRTEDRPQLGLKLRAVGASNGAEEQQGVMVMEVEPGDRPAAGYDHLGFRRFEFVPFWGFMVLLLYRMRRVDCRACGVPVEELPWAI